MTAAAAALILLTGCDAKKSDPKDEAPPPTTIVSATSVNNVKVDHPEQFPLATVQTQMAASSMSVTGQVQPDVTKVIPVISLASGRIVAIYAHIGDLVHKGQRLFTVQSNDIEQAYSDYRKAVADEKLAKVQLDRAKLLYSKGAISQSALEIAQDTEDKAVVDVEAAKEHLKVLGATDLNQPSGAINVYSPATGVIIEQNITQASGVKTLDNSPNLFTIANIEDVWIVCDVYENNLANLSTGQTATIHFNAFPDKDVTGRISEIDPILDPTIRTAKVRVQVRNPGYMKIGMFVTATFRSQKQEAHLVVPATAIVHLHDQDFVYSSGGGGTFTRIAVTSGDMLPGGMQVVKSGLSQGQQVAVNALELQSTVTQ
ncbi:efflux RND transporter periplasmic adaptor subunit [Granulicella arctica]|uniref:efflux RND transporter periplasmic adaptor subunit n=1 Tax=Granulicella arctica TaxID=940613 RepID=UPI0021E06DF9|nr:efflux RND transporter periplasmic adaptor subunit [Granulicella arctica]